MGQPRLLKKTKKKTEEEGGGKRGDSRLYSPKGRGGKVGMRQEGGRSSLIRRKNTSPSLS